MKKQNKIIEGLRETPVDNRDFQVGALFRLPSIAELPDNFELTGYRIKDQKDTDYCSAYMATGMSELQEDVELWPDFNFACSKELTGDNEEWGQNLRDALKALTKYGSVPQSEAVEVKKPRYLSSYPERLKDIAVKYKKQTFLNVKPTAGMDAFDTIRSTIWHFRNEKRAVGFGVVFGWNLDDKIIDTIPDSGFGHALYTVGWKNIDDKPYLIVVQSAGNSAGDNGVHYFSREVINHYVARYQAYMIVDMPREDVEYMLEKGIKVGDNWIIQFLKLIFKL